jgi:hypothetical protein
MNKWKYKMVHFLQLIPVSKLIQKKKKKSKYTNAAWKYFSANMKSNGII